MVILKKECEEVDHWTGKTSTYNRHLHLCALRDVPEEVRKMAWINREDGEGVVRV